MLSSDYSRLDLALVEWSSVDEFVDHAGLHDAIHSIELASGQRLDLVQRGLEEIGELSAIPFFFSGALPNRTGTKPPYFSGERMSAGLRLPWIAVSDPVLSRSDDFPLSWYTGLPGDGLQAGIARIADAISQKLARELLFVGGSGGGFASLVTLALSRRPARALVWNPQWDIRKYVPEFVREYVVKGLGIEVELEAVPSMDVPEGLLWRAPRLGDDKTLVYLQNLGDWHVRDHLLGFLVEQGFEDEMPGVFRRSALQVFLANFGVGHAVPPQGLLNTMLLQLTGGSIAGDELRAAAEGAGLWDHTAPPTLPPLVLPAGDDGGFGLTVDLRAQGDGTRVSLALPEALARRGHPHDVQFNLSARDVEGDKVVTGAQSLSEINFPHRMLDSVYATARDGFGRLISDASVRASPGTLPRAAREEAGPGHGVFLLGSCVSRDAFNLPGVPEIAEYVARTSLASAFEPVPTVNMPDLEKNPSKFQRRMVDGDWRKTLEAKLLDFDRGLVLVDLIDERFSQIHVGGSVVTGSPELQRCDPALFDLERDAPGSEAHLRRFRRGFERLTELVHPDRIIVSKVFWATAEEDGSLLPDQKRIADANATLRKLYGIVSNFPVHWIEYPAGLLVSSSNHRWGAAPFHYGAALYEKTIAGVTTALDNVYVAR